MTAAFTLVHDLVPLWLGTVWLVSVAWVRHDAARRIRNRRTALVAAVAALLLPVAGAVAWALVRPPLTLDERRRRRLAATLAELDAAAPILPGGGETQEALGAVRQAA